MKSHKKIKNNLFLDIICYFCITIKINYGEKWE